jgi:Lsr2
LVSVELRNAVSAGVEPSYRRPGTTRPEKPAAIGTVLAFGGWHYREDSPVQLTIDSAEPLDRVLAVIGALYGVKLTTPELPAVKPAAKTRSVSPIKAEKTAAARTPRSRTATTQPPRRAPATKPDPASVRAWAKANGHNVNDRGPMPAKLTDAYVAAGSPTG